MVRATAAEMLKLTVVYLPGHDATSYANFATTADTKADTAALPGSLSTTGANEIALCNRLAVRLVIHSVWDAAGGPLSGAPEPVVMTDEILAEIRQLTADTTYDGFATADMLDESDY